MCELCVCVCVPLQSNKVSVVQQSHGMPPLPLLQYPSADHFNPNSPHLPTDMSQKPGTLSSPIASLCLSPSLSLSLPLPMFLYLSVSLPLSLCLSLCFSLFLSLSLSPSLSFFLSLSPSLPTSLSPFPLSVSPLSCFSFLSVFLVLNPLFFAICLVFLSSLISSFSLSLPISPLCEVLLWTVLSG